MNPYKRRQPSELIPTGIAGIDLNNTIVSGQKIPFFADADQPYNQVMADVALRADVDKIILGGMGLSMMIIFSSVMLSSLPVRLTRLSVLSILLRNLL